MKQRLHALKKFDVFGFFFSSLIISQLGSSHLQQHHPRGNNALFHGCVPDRDVVDGVEAYQCPRCERKFSKQERRAFDEHIDKCTT